MPAHPTLVHVDPEKHGFEQPGLVNRWHPAIPAYATVKPGQVFKLECHDWTGGQIGNNDSADDLHKVDLSQIHYLSGPIAVEGAEPGDALVVDILDVTPLPQQPWGYTGIFDHKEGGLFAREFGSRATKCIWDFEGVYATSRHIPGVWFTGISHPGIIGTTPSQELLDTWNARENKLIVDSNGAIPPVAHLPNAKGAYVGQDVSEDVRAKVEKEGARTIPGREHGGNCDIKNLSRGSRCILPVYVSGGNLCVGDLHFSQGDGELSFCGAIEMAGAVTLKCSVIKNGMDMFALKNPIFIPSPIDPLYSQQVVFEGVSVDVHGTGEQFHMDATVAYKQAALNCIAYLGKLGYTREQAYLLLSAAPVESHVGSIVDNPNACVTLGLPVAIFEDDIMPSEKGLQAKSRGQAAVRSDGEVGIASGILTKDQYDDLCKKDGLM